MQKCAQSDRGMTLFPIQDRLAQHHKREDPEHGVGDVVKDKHGDALTDGRPGVIHHDPPAVDDIPDAKADADGEEEQDGEA